MGYFCQGTMAQGGAGRRKYVTDVDQIAVKLLISSFHILIFISYFSNRYLFYFYLSNFYVLLSLLLVLF